MLLVIEGIERCGKSTLVHGLSKALGWPYFDWSEEFGKVRLMPDYRSRINLAFSASYAVLRKVDWSKQDMIYQRFWISNEVYSEVLNDSVELRSKVKNYDPVNDFKDALVIWLDTSVYIVEDRLKKKGEVVTGERRIQLIKLRNAFRDRILNYMDHGGKAYSISALMTPDGLLSEVLQVLNSFKAYESLPK